MTNLEQLITEQQERNREVYKKEFGYPGDEWQQAFDVHLLEHLDQLTTDTAHAVALAVIGMSKDMKLEKEWGKHRSNGKALALNRDVKIGYNQALNDIITTLEEALQDNK